MMKNTLKKTREEAVSSTKVLNDFLANTYTLLLKTHAFHWNVTGEKFYNLHLLFENQYKDLFAAADELAERIRARGDYAPGGIGVYASMTSIEDPKEDASADDMLRTLIADNRCLADDAKAGIGICMQAGDDVTANMLTDRQHQHEKQMWMMKSILRSGKEI